ncbi:unnamed protein product [Parascedosporium putredinis]|uniref:Pyruvate decarboxylase n=1 Tax=Parascedosporium putredinis TaxID=1442378 RepID=A0A9P1H256_9PEZI|nr:unnamed protein product [Parascedosporium putredinis]CAI7994612.1 unnamed protein product [Parascedosporium putredinis]
MLATYAADGYARVKGMSALITTFGVGELSAVNGIAGAFSEQIPVVAKLNNPVDIANQIDFTLRECWIRSRPVYITLPTDMVEAKVEGERLRTPIDLSEPTNDSDRENYVVNVILRTLYDAKDPIILVDACSIRHRVIPLVKKLIEKTQLPYFMTPMGLCEGSSGSLGFDPFVGSLKSDFNTAGFSYRTSQLNTINLHSTYCAVRFAEYPGVRMSGVLKTLIEKVDVSKVNVTPPSNKNGIITHAEKSSIITHDYFWPKIGEFLKERDVVILWGSIGWSVGACQGAALATKDAKDDRRTILFVGDGSFQLTAQELSTMIRHNLTPIIFVICNEGFTIERYIHGMEASYNDIAAWKFQDLVTVFGGTDKNTRKIQVKTRTELETLLKEDEFNAAKKLQFVELYMPKEDAPTVLVKTAEASAKVNKKRT